MVPSQQLRLKDSMPKRTEDSATEGAVIEQTPSVKVQNLLTGIHTLSYGTNWENVEVQSSSG